jgi:hypothetical protein
MTIPAAYLTPDLAPSKEAMRRKMAYAMMMQGSSGEPVKHWTQGIARALQGGMGGYELYREKMEDEAREAKVGSPETFRAANPDLYNNSTPPGASPPVSAPPQAPMPPQRVPIQSQAPQRSPVVAALSPSGTMSDAPQVMTPPAQKVAPSPRVWGTDEGEAAGLYPPSKPAMQAPLPQAPPLAFNDRFAALNPQANPQQAGQLAPTPVQTQRVAQALIPQTSTQTMGAPRATPEQLQEIERLWRDPATRHIAAQAAERLKVKEQMRPLTDPTERQRYGIGPEDKTPYQVGADNKVTAINPQPFQVNVNSQQESEFKKKAGTLQAERFNELAADGRVAQQMSSDVEMLRDLGTKIQTGKLAEVKGVIGPYAEALGVKVDGLSEIQAYEAIVNRVAPNLRVKGSGAQSDYELRGFLKSIPSVGNTPEGNEIVARTLQGLTANKMKAAEIGAEALSGNISAKDAEKALRELPDPMKEWREHQKTLKKSAEPTVIDGYKIRERK